MMDGDEDANDEEVPPPLENIMFEMDDDKDMKKHKTCIFVCTNCYKCNSTARPFNV